jgi:Uma2 family endonuclease
MLKYLEPLHWLPSAEDLPDSDDKPVDSELQEHLPTLLKSILLFLWKDRHDWFCGVDLGIYYDPDQPAIVPDLFISLGADRVKDPYLRPSYVLWEEKGIIPQFVLEVVSKTYRREYTTKKDLYQNLGVLYYGVYNNQRKRKPRFELYKLINGTYVPVIGNPIWMPELGLGIGKDNGHHRGIDREWLFWYNEAGERYLTPEERAEQAEDQLHNANTAAQKAEQKTAQLIAQLRALGIEPEV